MLRKGCVKNSQLSKEDAERPCVSGDVMHCEYENPRFVVSFDQRRSQQWRPREIERLSSASARQSARLFVTL